MYDICSERPVDYERGICLNLTCPMRGSVLSLFPPAKLFVVLLYVKIDTAHLMWYLLRVPLAL